MQGMANKLYLIPAELSCYAPHKERDSMEAWMTWIEPLNAMAGRTLVEIATCQDCGRAYPASLRQRVHRCPACWHQARRR